MSEFDFSDFHAPAKLSTLPEDRRFRVILADPPWKFEVYDRDTGTGRSAESYYDTMHIDELKKLNVAKLASEHCSLFMWSTWTHLPVALELGTAWGFEYKTCAFLWAKLNKEEGLKPQLAMNDALWFFGMGYHTRANTEPCLLFTKGSPKRRSAAVRQLIVAPIREHSQKPIETYDRIEKLQRGPYLELFSREARKDWSVLGNETDGRDLREVLK